MKKLIQHITLFCIALLPAVLGGCVADSQSGNSPDLAGGEWTDVELTLNVCIGNTLGIASTRAQDASGEYDFVQSNIDHELIKTLRIIIVRPDNSVEYNSFITLDEAGVKVVNNEKVDDMKFQLSTDMGHADENRRSRTERKRIFLIANEESLDQFESNIVGEGQKITDILKGLKPAYTPTEDEKKEGKVGHAAAKLDPYAAERWIIYNTWTTNDNPNAQNYAVPMIDNTDPAKSSYIPMTEVYDLDVTSIMTLIDEDEEDTEDDDNKFVDTKPQPLTAQTADLFITRNFVKFIFTAKSDTESFKITGIRFHNLMQKEYLFPFNTIYSPAKAINILSNREIVEFSTPGFAGNNIRPYQFNPGESMLFMKGDEPKLFAPLIYFCETHNYEANTNNLSRYGVSVDVDYLLSNGKVESVTYNADYITGLGILNNLPYSLPRNTIVKVDLTIKDRQLDAVATVYPYTGVWLKPSFGFGVPVKSVGIKIMDFIKDPEKENTAIVAESQSITLIGYVKPDDANNHDLIWTSSDSEIATVSSEGVVTGVSGSAEGKIVEITAKSVDNPSESATCQVKVTQKIPVESITLSEDQWTAKIGETKNLKVTFIPENATNQNLTWESSNDNIVKVSSSGTITVVDNPSTTEEAVVKITATSKDNEKASATCTVNVKPKVMVTGVSLTPNTKQTIFQGGQANFTAAVSPSTATDQDVTWESKNPEIASVSSYGLVTGITPGTTEIKATAKDGSGKYATCDVEVLQKTPVREIELNITEWAGVVGGPQSPQLTATVLPDDATYKGIIWSSSNPDVARVNTNNNKGYIIPEREGTAEIYAISADNPEIKGTCKVTVSSNTTLSVPITGIQITKKVNFANPKTLSQGESYEVRASITPTNATDKTAVVWISSDDKIASISSIRTLDGESCMTIKAVAPGEAIITVFSINYPDVKPATLKVIVTEN